MKFSRPFLKICKWFLVNKMSSNHKHSCSCYNQKQPKIWALSGLWKTTLFLLLWLVPVFFVSIWVLSSFYVSKFNIEREDYNNRDVLEKVASFACCKGIEYALPQSSNVVCAVKSPVFENLIPDKCEFVTGEKCSSFLNTTFSYMHLCCKVKESQMIELRSHVTDHCKGIYVICLWVFIGMAIIYNLCKLIMSQKKHKITQQQSRSTGKWRKKLLVVFVSVGVVFSFWLFWYLKKDIMLRRKDTLASMCDERARMLQDQFNVSMNHVHALAILISTFHHDKQSSAIDQRTFEDYTERTSFERPLTSGVAYALRVRQSERERVEKQYGWTIKKMNIEDQTLVNTENYSTSPIRDEYAPAIFSQKTVSHIVSIDMMSGKEDRENILRARASGKGVLTSPFKLLKSNHLGVVLTFAVYNTDLPPDVMPEERINATVGYIGASYDVPSLVEKLLHQLASKQTIIVNVYDTTSPASRIKMYGADVADNGLLHTSYLDFGDPARKHEMHCRFKHKPPPPWQAISASVGVLVITLLLGHIFHAAIKQIAKVEHDYREMMELKHRAEAADVAKSQFLATVSHEIRTPMNGVLGMLEMLMDTNLDVCQLDYAQTAHDSGKVLISLINKVLDQAKIESGRLELEAVPFDPRAVLDKVLSIFSGISHEKGIELAAYVSDKVPEVVIGDQERFGQIITNLVGNSIKFTHDKGHIFVSVHLADEVQFPHDEILRQNSNLIQDDLNRASFNTLSGFRVVDRWRSWKNFKNLSEQSEKVKLLVTVEDTGTGIPPEAQDRVFMPFMQADSSTSRKYGGTGIGLSISNRLVDLMGGEIGFSSELDTGSTFSFTVTFMKAEANSPIEKLWRPCDISAVSVFQGIRALVIDQKRIRAEVTSYHLRRLGISVDVTSCMESACSFLTYNGKTSVLESEKIAMVLIDQEYWDKHTCIPFRNIIKTTRHNNLRAKSALLIPLKIFLLSNDRNNKLKLDELVDDLITKPLRLSALASTLREATGKRLEASGQPSPLKSLLRGKRILVVDDNAVNRRVAEGALKKYGGVVTCVERGKFAVELLKPPHEFDACFMDLQMPEMDGFEATRQIRILEKKHNEQIGETSVGWRTPILAMTADVIQATNEACVKCGMDDYVSKPFGEGQLYSAVARFFETTR